MAFAPNEIVLPKLNPGSVCDFYSGRSVFITGATGFMGKVLAEKLLRSCMNIKNIYVLMRPKAGQDIRRRLEELLNARVSDVIQDIFSKMC